MKMENVYDVSFLSEENLISNSDIKLLLKYLDEETGRIQNLDIFDSFKMIILATLRDKVMNFVSSRNLSLHHTYLYKGIIPFSTIEFPNYPYIIFYYRYDIINFDDYINNCNFKDEVSNDKGSLIFKKSIGELYARLVEKNDLLKLSFLPFRIINLNEKGVELDENIMEKLTSMEIMYKELIKWLLNVEILIQERELERVPASDEEKKSYIANYCAKILSWFEEKNKALQISTDNYLKYSSMRERLCTNPENRLKYNQYVYPGLNESRYSIEQEFKDVKDKFKKAYRRCNNEPYLRVLFRNPSKF